jgi:8-oxo-dGTP pyrophosphatase MutT (NUDIX family)
VKNLEISGSPEHLLHKLAEACNHLPGEDAQFKMAPRLRKQRVLSNWPISDANQSAVLILLYPKASQLFTILMKRTEYSGAHSGQISFPGGRYEKTDSNMQFTALRETEEEFGIKQKEVKTIGKLTELYVPASHFNIHPYIAWLDGQPEITPDPIEVAEVIHVPLNTLFQEENKGEKDMPLKNGMTIKAPYYDVHNHVVWGATAMIISEMEAVFSKLK